MSLADEVGEVKIVITIRNETQTEGKTLFLVGSAESDLYERTIRRWP